MIIALIFYISCGNIGLIGSSRFHGILRVLLSFQPFVVSTTVVVAKSSDMSFVGVEVSPVQRAPSDEVLKEGIRKSLDLLSRPGVKVVRLTLRGGVYRLTRGLDLSHIRLGLLAQGKRLEILGEEGSSAVISGYNVLDGSIFDESQELTTFSLGSQYTLNRTSRLISGAGHSQARRLVVRINGELAEVARFPENGWLSVLEWRNSASFRPSISPPMWGNFETVSARGFWRATWEDEQGPVRYNQDGVLDLGFEPYSSNEKPRKGVLVRFENSRSFISNSRQYAFNEISGELSVRSVSSQHPPLVEVSANIEYLLKLSGCSGITVGGISFCGVSGDGIWILDSSDIRISDCNLSGIGRTGVYADGTRIILNHLNITETGACGVFIKGGSRDSLLQADNRIIDSTISRFGMNDLCYNPGVRIAGGCGISIEGCEIFDGPHSAVIFKGNFHVIKNCSIHDVCKVANDCAPIYCGRDWALHGCEIRDNLIYNIFPNQNGANIHGIYLDDCASGVAAYQNVLVGIPDTAIKIGGGHENQIYRNLIIRAKVAICDDDRGLHHSVASSSEYWKLCENANGTEVNTFSDQWIALKSLSKWRVSPRLRDLVESDFIPYGSEIRENWVYDCGSEYASLISPRSSESLKYAHFEIPRQPPRAWGEAILSNNFEALLSLVKTRK